VHVDRVPILLNVLVADAATARAVPGGTLDLHGCDGCGLLWNAAFAGVPYDPSYQVDQSLSPRFAAHLDDVATRWCALREGPVRVLEIGCGQGVFLGILGRRLGARLEAAHGFDPAFRGDSAHLPPGARVTRDVLDARSVADLPFAPDLVVLRHTIEHVPDPVAFLRTIHDTLAPRGPFTIALETPDAGFTLARGRLHDFCYEHCSLHSGPALTAALQRAGFSGVSVEPAFDGEYLLATASSATGAMVGLAGAPGTHAAFRALGERFVREHRAALAAAEPPVAVWGGAGKGALFALLVDPDRRLIDCVIDIHPAKRGSFLPGTGLPVVSPDDARARGVRSIVVANENYLTEVDERCRAAGWDAKLSSIASPVER
jgi:SAM-dependent methyltransferase